MAEILTNGINPYEQLRLALEVADHVDVHTFVNDIDMLRELGDALVEQKALPCQLLGCGNGDVVSTFDILCEVIQVFTTFLKSDFDAIYEDVRFPYQIVSCQIGLAKRSYEKYRERFLEVASYTLQRAAMLGLSVAEVLIENHFDINLTSSQYSFGFQWYTNIVYNLENTTYGGFTCWNPFITIQKYRKTYNVFWSLEFFIRQNVVFKEYLFTRIVVWRTGSVANYGCGIWAPSQYKDRLIYVWRFPC